ncbi:MAG TPA: hypothetical protein VNT24_14155 [Propionibacteriaceae bacterium]|nr:hypothetical protein [Propionibacteriaceae bacterium]
MAWFRRQRPDRVVLTDLGVPENDPWVVDPGLVAEQHASLRRIAAEAVIMQDEAEAVILGIRARESLGYLAPRGGPLIRRFFALRDRLPRRCDDPDDERLRGIMDVTFHHHAMALATALEFCALEWRSPEIARQVDALDGLGAPARRLDEVYSALKTSDMPTDASQPPSVEAADHAAERRESRALGLDERKRAGDA